MPEIVQFTAPGRVDVVEQPPAVLEAGAVRLATWFSGISAGTELTAYRASTHTSRGPGIPTGAFSSPARRRFRTPARVGNTKAP